jgi:hypothetical protein
MACVVFIVYYGKDPLNGSICARQTDKLEIFFVRYLPASEMSAHLHPPLVRWFPSAFHCATIPAA